MQTKMTIVDIYSSAKLKALMLQIKYLRKLYARSIVVAVVGGNGCGKTSLCSHLSRMIPKFVCKQRLECDIVSLPDKMITLTKSKYKSMSQCPFVSVFLCSCRNCEHADLNITMIDVISFSKVNKKFSISEGKLRAFSYNLTLCMRDDSLVGIPNTDLISSLFSKMYSKRCNTSMERVSSDMNNISLFDVCSNSVYEDVDLSKIIELFVESRPHVKTILRMHLNEENSNDNMIEDATLKRKTQSFARMETNQSLNTVFNTA